MAKLRWLMSDSTFLEVANLVLTLQFYQCDLVGKVIEHQHILVEHIEKVGASFRSSLLSRTGIFSVYFTQLKVVYPKRPHSCCCSLKPQTGK